MQVTPLVRRLTGEDAQVFFELRLEALELEPHAFSAAAEDHRTLPLEAVAERLAFTAESRFVLGAFLEGALVGSAGFVRSASPKTAHSGIVWGVYVTNRARGRGVGRALLTALIARVRTFRGVEQVTLSVSTPQKAAKTLYLSLGFEVYGLERRALKVAGQYADEEHLILYF